MIKYPRTWTSWWNEDKRTISDSRPFPLPSIEVSTDSIESEKVRRLCRFGQNLPLSERIQPENLFPFTSVQWTPTAAETSDWRKSQKIKIKTAYRLVQIGPNTICCFLSFGKGCFLETQIKRAGGQLRSLQKNQNPYVSFVERLECQLLLYLYASLYPFIRVLSMSEAR